MCENMKKVSIIDYGLSNIHNVVEAFKYIGASVNVITSPNDLIYDYLVLPGVGSFEKGVHHINKMNLKSSLLTGFGISNKQTYMDAIKYSNGAIIGSDFVNHLKANGLDKSSDFI